MRRSYNKDPGAALVELVIALIIVGALAAGGIYILQQHTAVTPVSDNTTVPALDGTSASIDQLTQADAQTDAKADSSADSRVQQDAASANNSISNVGGAYDETKL